MRASRKMWHENQRAQSPEDRIVDVKERASPANVKISRLAAESYGCDLRSSSSKLARGKTAYAVIKTSDFMVELD